MKLLNKVKTAIKERSSRIFDLSLKAWDTFSTIWEPLLNKYPSPLTVEQWKAILTDRSIVDNNSLLMIKQVLEQGNAVTLDDLSNLYAIPVRKYEWIKDDLVRRICEKSPFRISPYRKKYDYVPFQYSKKNKSYKLRDELVEATQEITGLFDGLTENGDSGSGEISLAKYPLNTIFYGPPGTGKTYAAARYAVKIITGKDLEKPFEEYRRLLSEGRIGFVTFHQSYGYEEFIEGIRPNLDDNPDSTLTYREEDGIFKEFCERAKNSVSAVGLEGLNESPTVWKVSLKGAGDNPIRTECLENGHIRIGWHEYGKEITDETVYDMGGRYVLDAFINKMSIGDVVVSCYSETTTDAIGIITSDYYYDSKNGKEYPRYRDVKWIRKFKDSPQNITAINSGKVMTLASVYKMKIPLKDVLELAGEEIDTSVPEKRFVFIIDEINRGNISRIFGELITLLEESKRRGNEEETIVKLPYTKEDFSVPNNVYVIGTMNTADKSLVSLDTALRRRFKFKEVITDYSLLTDDLDGINVQDLLRTVNERIEFLYDRDHMIGHSYMMNLNSLEDLNAAFVDSVIPLLQEYFMDDFEKIGQILAPFGKMDASCSKFLIDTKYSASYPNMPRKRYALNPLLLQETWNNEEKGQLIQIYQSIYKQE